MKKQKFYIEVKESEYNAEFEAIELLPEENETHYGNGIYIRINRNGQMWKYLDCRYEKYDCLKNMAIRYFNDYFGDNLVKITEID